MSESCAFLPQCPRQGPSSASRAGAVPFYLLLSLALGSRYRDVPIAKMGKPRHRCGSLPRPPCLYTSELGPGSLTAEGSTSLGGAGGLCGCPWTPCWLTLLCSVPQHSRGEVSSAWPEMQRQGWQEAEVRWVCAGHTHVLPCAHRTRVTVPFGTTVPWNGGREELLGDARSHWVGRSAGGRLGHRAGRR